MNKITTLFMSLGIDRYKKGVKAAEDAIERFKQNSNVSDETKAIADELIVHAKAIPDVLDRFRDAIIKELE